MLNQYWKIRVEIRRGNLEFWENTSFKLLLFKGNKQMYFISASNFDHLLPYANTMKEDWDGNVMTNNVKDKVAALWVTTEKWEKIKEKHKKKRGGRTDSRMDVGTDQKGNHLG